MRASLQKKLLTSAIMLTAAEAALGVDVSETGKPATIQERAWTSPIWYTP